MKQIKLTQGQFALVDDEDFEYLNQFYWQAVKHGNTYYARRVDKTTKGKRIYMHREITNCPKIMVIDHANRNGIDNQKANLRVCTQSQNMANKLPLKGSRSKYMGVCYHKGSKKWVAQMDSKGKHIYIGLFKTEENAAIAYNIYAERLHGEFARLNIAS